MATTRLALFDTAIGRCGLAWHETAVVGVQIPEVDDDATITRLKRLVPLATRAEPDGFALEAVNKIRELMDGKRPDLAAIPVDVGAVSSLCRSVYEVTRAIPPGEVLTYGEVAKRIGQPGAAQAVGQALGANPIPIIVPCHRVVGANHSLVGFSANGGIETKRKMLLIEGSTAVTPSLFDDLS